MKGRMRRFWQALVIAAGIGLSLYPWISNRIYEQRADSEVRGYEKKMEESDRQTIREQYEAAQIYNTALLNSRAVLTDPFEGETSGEAEDYESVLAMDESGILCFVEIPCIDVLLPVYHGTSAEVLQKGAGHLEGSSLPIGQTGSRAVISAHTGINSAKMFSDLTEVASGDLFFIHVLDQTLAYQVCETEVILPEETSGLAPEAGRDLVSLVTCTPYGVNTHRLVVTGERTEYTEKEKEKADAKIEKRADSEWMRAYRRALLMGFALIGALAGILRLCRFWKNARGRGDS